MNLRTVASGRSLDNFTKMSSIAKSVCDAGGVPHNNPLDI